MASSAASEDTPNPLDDSEEKTRLHGFLIERGFSEEDLDNLYKGNGGTVFDVGRQEEDVKEALYAWMDLGEEELYQEEMALRKKFAPKIPQRARMNVESHHNSDGGGGVW